MSLHYHYEMIVDKAIKSAINDIVQLDFAKRAKIADAFKGVRNEVLTIILPDVYGKTVDVPAVATGGDVAVPSVSEPAVVDMVHQSGGATAPVKKPSPRKKGAK